MDTTRLDSANKIIRRYGYVGAAGGFLPLPVLDIALVAGTQIKMIMELAKLYGVDVGKDVDKKEAVKAAIGALVGGTVPAIGRQAVLWASSSMLKSVPLVGTLLGTVVSSFVASQTTRAIGRVYVMHFEAGGTLLDFSPEKMRGYFRGALAAEATAAETPPAEPAPAVTQDAPAQA